MLVSDRTGPTRLEEHLGAGTVPRGEGEGGGFSGGERGAEGARGGGWAHTLQ